MAEFSAETVTFLFTDSQSRVTPPLSPSAPKRGRDPSSMQEPEPMREALAHHDALLRAAIEKHAGRVFKTIGDAFCAVFASALDAVHAAVEAQSALLGLSADRAPAQGVGTRTADSFLKVRMALHTGAAEARGGDYFGPALNKVARLLAAGHGGQVLLSEATATRVFSSLSAKTQLRHLGSHRLRDIATAETIYQLLPPGLPSDFPPLNTLDTAFRRGVIRAAAVATAVVGLVGWLALSAYRAESRAARVAEDRRQTLYAMQINAAQQAWEVGNLKRARALLMAQRPVGTQSDLRGFEWRYLWHLCRDDSLFTYASPHPGDRITAIAFSPDGKTFAVGGKAGTVAVWDLPHRRRMSVLAERLGWVFSLAISPNGRKLAAAGYLDSVRVWDLPSGKEQPRLSVPGGATGVDFSPDGRTLATVGWDGTVRLWEIATRQPREAYRGLHPRAEGFLTLRFSRDGRFLAYNSGKGTTQVWSVASRRFLATFGRRLTPALAISPDSRLLATASTDNTVTLWDTRTWRERATLSGHANVVWAIAFSPDGKTVASSSDDGTVKLWDATTFREVGSLRVSSATVLSVDFSPDGKTLATGDEEKAVKLWNVTTREQVATLRGHDGLVGAVAFSPDGSVLASGGGGVIRLWPAPPPAEPASASSRPGASRTGLSSSLPP